MLYFSLLLYIVVQSLCGGIFMGPIGEGLKEIFSGDKLPREPEDDNFNLSVYHTLDEINDHLNFLQRRYPELVKVELIGTTLEKNPITWIKIGSCTTCTDKSKPAIWIDSCIHASEWIAAATSLYIIEHLVKGYDTDPEIQHLVDTYDWYIIPVLNPDGYKFSWTEGNRLWQKNRSYNMKNMSRSDCRGTNLNRNFDIDFEGLRNSSADPCSDYYRGKAAFSEPESRAVREVIFELGDRLRLVISFHSYGQLWMSPYAFSRDLPLDHKGHVKVMELAVSTIMNDSGETYRYGTISNVVNYLTSSSFTDWVYIKGNVKYSFVVLLRDTGEHGNDLPNTCIIPTAEENFAAIKAVVSNTTYLL